MSYSATILADSVSPDGVRLTTLQVTFPRFILAEFNTHRMLSRNSASSRAIPTEKLIERVRHDPFVPETFNKRVKGMGVGEVLDDQDKARLWWNRAREYAITAAEELLALDVDKSRANRLLEPFMWHTCIVSATEWANFFALRDHQAAQPEMQITARLMREARDGSSPQRLEYGQWHLPMVSREELAVLCQAPEQIEVWKLVSAGRVARVSFDTHENFEPPENSVVRGERMRDAVPAHLSPFEHVARPMRPGDDCINDEGIEPYTGYAEYHIDKLFLGNFRGWVQMRKEIVFEARADLAIAAAAS